MNNKNLFAMCIVAALSAAPSGVFSLGAYAATAGMWAASDSTTANKAYVGKTLTYDGVITSKSTGAAVQGAILEVAGDNRFTAMTDSTGRFTINVPVYAGELIVRAPLYAPRRVHLSPSGRTLDIQMYSESFTPGEVKDVRITNSGSVTDFSLTSALTVDDELSRKAGGNMRVLSRSANPAQGASMFIGGYNSLNANAQPLFVVDGVILDRQVNRGLMHEGYINNVLSAISVNDIEKVTVLKNATALYGAKGANGVVIIETRRARSMATRIDVDIWGSMELMPKLPDMLNADQYRLYVTDVDGNMTTTPDYLNDYTTDKQKYATYHNNTDWRDVAYREAFTQNYGINVQGGDDVASYNLSIGYANAQSTLKNNDFSRLNMRFNTDVSIAKPLICRLDVAYSNTTRNLRDDGITGANIFSPGAISLIKAPILNTYVPDKNGNFTSTLADADIFGVANPQSILENGEASNKNRVEYSLFSLNVTPEWSITKDLVLSQKVSYVLNNVSERYFLPDEGVPTLNDGNEYETTNRSKAFSSKQTSVQTDTRLRWSHRYNAHSIDLFGGFRYLSDSYTSDGITADNTAGDKLPDITNSMVNRSVKGILENWKSTAVYLNADWNYAGRYYLQGTVTAETSTRFGSNATGGVKLGDYVWGVFPSLQAAWVISGEKFFRGVRGVDYLKLNVGIDQSGNDDIDCFASRTYFSSEPFLNQTAGLALANIGNDQLKWETTTRLTAGVDAAFLNDRIAVGFNFFKSYTDNLLTLKSLDGVSGLKQYWCNEGSMENIGFDASLRVKLLAMKDFSWEAGAGVGFYRNEITALPDGNADILTSLYGAQILTSVGQPAGLFYGYQTEGVFATAAEAAEANLYNGSLGGRQFQAGDVHFTDRMKDHIISKEDRTVIGDPNPDFYGQFSTRLSYKQWTLDALFTYSVGNDIYNYQRSVLESGSTHYNQTTALLNRWTIEGQQTDVPRVTYGDPLGNSRFSDRWIEDGSYLRLKTLRLSWRLPLTLSWLQGITVWGAANNVFTCTKYLGSDPEVTALSGVIGQGIDRGVLGHGRSFVLGVKINL